MSNENHETFREWLHLEDGLDPAARAALRRHLGGCAECRAESDAMARLDDLLAASRVEVRQGFQHEVMQGVRPAGWESRNPRAWWTAAVLFLLIAAGATVATVFGGGAQQGAPLAAAAAAVVDLFQTAALAGAGLLTASWQGVAVAVRQALGGSPLPLAVLGLLILGLDVLFVRLLLRARSRRQGETVIRRQTQR